MVGLKRKKENRTGIILITLFITFSMVFSIFAIVMDANTDDQLEYNKQKFIRTETGYSTKINNEQMNFYFFPSELETINISENIVSKINNAQLVVFLFDPNQTQEDLTYIDAARYDFEQQMNIPVYSAIIYESENYQSLPVLSCDNATAETPFIILNISSNTGFVLDETNSKCIIMNARWKDILASQERFIYGLYGIMK